MQGGLGTNTGTSGNALVIGSSSSVVIALTWGGVRYPWSSVHTLTPLVLGLVGLVFFFVYEVKFAKNALVHPAHSYQNYSSDVGVDPCCADIQSNELERVLPSSYPCKTMLTRQQISTDVHCTRTDIHRALYACIHFDLHIDLPQPQISYRYTTKPAGAPHPPARASFCLAWYFPADSFSSS